jgi:thiol-disulfide isomerase/thioredoxin
MRRIFVLIVIGLITTTTVNAQAQYQISYDQTRNNVKVLTGIINKYLMMNDSAFSWYGSSHKAYNANDTSILQAFAKDKNNIQYVVFGGTWCEDTRNILPKFFRLQEQAGVPDEKVTLIGVDGNKKTLGNLHQAMNIRNVPTIIIMKNGKELGRVIEYGKTGKWDKELADILKAQ